MLLRLSDAYSLGGGAHKQPPVFGRVLWLFDNFPDEVGPLSHSIHWQLKWLTLRAGHQPGRAAGRDLPLVRRA